MTQNQKILVGVGVLGIAYLIWKGSKKTKSTVQTDTGGSGGKEIVHPSPDDCLIRYEKALAAAKQAGDMGAMVGLPPKEIFIKNCEFEKAASLII